MQAVLQLMEKITGFDFLADLATFLTAVEGLSGGFVERADRIEARLLDASTGFVLVSGPSRQTLLNTALFLDHLAEYDISPVALILNRMHLWPGDGEIPECLTSTAAGDVVDEAVATLAAGLSKSGAPDEDDRLAAQRSFDAARVHSATVQLDLDNSADLRHAAETLGCVVHLVPELQEDIHDLPGLERVAETVFRESRLTRRA